MGVIFHLIRKEFLQVRRDKAMLGIIFVIPLIQLFVLGYAITTDVTNINLAVVDQDHSRESRDLMERFTLSDRFILRGLHTHTSRVQAQIDTGEVSIGLVIPPNFSRNLTMGASTEIQILVDGVDSNSSLIASGYAQGIILKYLNERLTGVAAGKDFVRIRAFYNPELESSFTIVPGIVALLLTIVTMLLTALGLVREREIGTLEQLNVTPIKPWQLIIGKIAPFGILGGLSFTVALTVAMIHFHIPLEGRLSALIIFTIIYLLTNLGLGMFISTATSTQQQSVFMAWFLIVMSVLMSGFMFPISNMPEFLQKLTYLIPLRYYITALREIMLKGTPIWNLMFQLKALSIFCITILTFSLLKFRKRLA